MTFTYDNKEYSTIVHEYCTLKDLIVATNKNLLSLVESGYEIYAKPFYEYLYDKDLLEIKFKEYDININVLNHLHPYHCFFKSFNQQNPRTDNQTYLINGIKHNVVDTLKLLATIQIDN